ncbi:MAG: hypothetical protein IGS48_07590 [Oscillatoriales cyanobacterium C42_A2020_001]|nr:hypothetical protein [Leptolyngbyaceae cyanobacterium C42_A2020_001]
MSVVASQGMMAAAIAQEAVYKVRLRDVSTGNANQASVFSSGDLDREEWVVVTVVNNKQVKVRHTTSIKNKFWGTRQWHDHPATALRVCISDGFDKKDCQTANSDAVAMPSGKSIYDLAIDFKYSEGGNLYTRSIQLTPEVKPEQAAN